MKIKGLEKVIATIEKKKAIIAKKRACYNIQPNQRLNHGTK